MRAPSSDGFDGALAGRAARCAVLVLLALAPASIPVVARGHDGLAHEPTVLTGIVHLDGHRIFDDLLIERGAVVTLSPGTEIEVTGDAVVDAPLRVVHDPAVVIPTSGARGGDGVSHADVRITVLGDLDVLAPLLGRVGGAGRPVVSSEPRGRGGDGGAGSGFVIVCGGVLLLGGDVVPGGGGPGGSATLVADAGGGVRLARGGDGGDAGAVSIRAGTLLLDVGGGGRVVLSPGGEGGDGVARGGDAEAGRRGGAARARGGAAGAASQVVIRTDTVSASPVPQEQLVVVRDLPAAGGSASAFGGSGGAGDGPEDAAECPKRGRRGRRGGSGGAADARGGAGGTGGSLVWRLGSKPRTIDSLEETDGVGGAATALGGGGGAGARGGGGRRPGAGGDGGKGGRARSRTVSGANAVASGGHGGSAGDGGACCGGGKAGGAARPGRSGSGGKARAVAVRPGVSVATPGGDGDVGVPGAVCPPVGGLGASVAVAPTRPTRGVPATVTVTVRNYRDSAASEVGVVIELDGEAVADSTLASVPARRPVSLEPGEGQALLAVTFPTSGRGRKIKVVVDGRDVATVRVRVDPR